jgi:predicted methyltransferase
LILDSITFDFWGQIFLIFQYEFFIFFFYFNFNFYSNWDQRDTKKAKKKKGLKKHNFEKAVSGRLPISLPLGNKIY